MRKIIFLSLISILISNEIDYIKHNSFLFCLKKDSPNLIINNKDNYIITNSDDINLLIQKFNIKKIDKWLKHASESDYDKDIYLSKIYRVYIKELDLEKIKTIKNEFEKLINIHSTDYDYKHKSSYATNDLYFNEQFYLEQVNTLEAWDYFIDEGVILGDPDIVLASVDSGVDYTHPDLKANIFINQLEIPASILSTDIDLNADSYISSLEIEEFLISQNMDNNFDGEINLRDLLASGSIFLDGIDGDENGYIDDIIGWDTFNDVDDYNYTIIEDNDPYPKEGIDPNSAWSHGTHVGGLLSATTDNEIGMASISFNTKLLSVKIADEDQDGSDGIWFPTTVEGMYYAAITGHNLDKFTVLNCSFGRMGDYSDFEQSAINVMYNDYNAIIIAAAGNDATSQCGYPACYDNVISVSALDIDGLTAAEFTNYGEEIDISAPGVNILSSIISYDYEGYDYWDYAYWSGTSMATPIVASGIALLKNYFPNYSNQELIERLLLSSNPIIYQYNSSCNYGCLGFGIMDLKNAIDPYLTTLNLLLESYLYETNIADTLNINFILTNNSLGQIDVNNASLRIECEELIFQANPNSILIDSISSGISIENTFTMSFDDNNSLGNHNCKMILEFNGQIQEYAFTVSLNLFQHGFPFSTTFEVKSSPIVADIDNDGILEIIFGDKNGLVHVVSSLTGVEWENDIFPFDTGNEIWGALAYGDIDLDGLNEILVPSKSKSLYAIDINGVDFNFDAGQFLMGTPAIGNLDEDDFLEVVVSGYTASGDVFIINHDGTSNSIIEINEKALGGVSLADFNDNGQDEIIISTGNDDMICMIDNSGNIDTLLIANDKFQTSTSILDIDGEKIIMAGSYDHFFYAIDSQGQIIFSVETGDDINSSPAFLQTDSEVLTFFGSDDGYLYAVKPNGDMAVGWPVPVNIENEVGTPSFSDLDGDGNPEIVVSSNNKIYAFYLDGSYFNSMHFPIQTEFSITSAPIIRDIDGDGDLEIIFGTSANIVVIDVIDNGGISSNYWNMYRGNNARTGLFEGSLQIGDINNDENTDIFDIIIIINMILNDDPYNFIADINADGNIDVSDIIALLNFILEN